ncbi:hypothetical protein [Campylobacter sp. RM12637]
MNIYNITNIPSFDLFFSIFINVIIYALPILVCFSLFNSKG